MKQIHVVNLKNGGNTGDNNNSTAVTKKVLEKIPEVLHTTIPGVLHTTLDVDKAGEIDDFIRSSQEVRNTKYIFIGAGLQSIEALTKAKKGLTDCISLWSGHQSYQELLDNEENLDKIALPVTEKLDLKDTSKRIATLGVPSLITKDDVIKEYKARKNAIIKSDNGYIAVVMGGDANNPKLESTETNPDKQQYYTVEEAKKLADYMTFIYKKSGKKLLITNGPRTGKYDVETGKVTQNHRGETATDPCSAALVERLKENGLTAGEDFQFEDFRFLEGGVASAYKSYLGAVKATEKKESFIIMAGESTSMLTDCLNVETHLVAFENNAMNESHNSFFKMLNNNGYMYALDKDFKIIKTTDEYKSDLTTYIASEEQIASTIGNMINTDEPKATAKAPSIGL